MKKVYKSMLALGIIASGAMLAQPVQADELVATCTFTIRPMNSSFQMESPVDIQVAVMSSGETTSDDPDAANSVYYITETDGLGYIPYDVKFVDNPGEGGSAIFEQSYEGEKNGMFIWFSPITHTGEPQGQQLAKFSMESGFQFINQSGTNPTGFGWFSSSVNTGLTPDMKYVNEIIITDVKDWKLAGVVTYPTLEEIAGTYVFKANNFEVTSNCPAAYKSMFNQEFEFTINASGNILGFTYDEATSLFEYDQATGIITYKTFYARPTITGAYLYMNPSEGGYTGMSVTNGNPLKFYVSPEGTISIPDFDWITNTAQPFIVAVAYSDIEVTPAEIIEPEVFAGTYEIAGTTFDFTGNELSMDYGVLKLVVNENNKITSILGYDISDELVNTTYVSAGKVDGNKIVFPTGKTGLPLEYSETPLEGSAKNFTSMNYTFVSGPSTAGDEPSNADLVLTKNEDGTYSLSSFTVWTQVQELVNPGDLNDETTTNIYTLLYKWEQGEVEYVEPTNFDGAYTISGYFYNYAPVDDDIIAVQANPTPQQGEFVLQINKKNQAVRFADFSMDETSIKDGENIGIVEGNQLTWEAGFPEGMRYTNWDTLQYYYIGGPSTAEFTPGETITFTKVSDEEYSLSPFTVWERKVVNMTPTYTLLQAWNTSVGTGVENIVVEKFEPVYYDLQGRKVNNPERGIYIMKVGNSVKKILK